MNVITLAVILSLSVSADALACGYGAGASRLKVPLTSAFAAGIVSAFCVGAGMAAANSCIPLLPEYAGKYISFAVLSVFGLIKIGGSANNESVAGDVNYDRRLSVGEGFALGAAISVDGLAAGIGYSSDVYMLICTCVCTCVFSTAALYLGAKSGRGAASGRTGNIVAGLALVMLALQKLLFG